MTSFPFLQIAKKYDCSYTTVMQILGEISRNELALQDWSKASCLHGDIARAELAERKRRFDIEMSLPRFKPMPFPVQLPAQQSTTPEVNYGNCLELKN